MPSTLNFGAVSAGSGSTSAGKSHSWLRPTSRSRSAQRAHDLGGAGDQADDALPPSPRLRGEGWGEGLRLALAHVAALTLTLSPSALKERDGERASGHRIRSRRGSRPRRPRRAIGVAEHRAGAAKVWNSPFSAHGSTPAGRSASSAASKRRPAKLSGSFRGSTQVTWASSPPAIISRASVAGVECPTAGTAARCRCRRACPRGSGGCPPGTGRRTPWPRCPPQPARPRTRP